MQDFVHQPYVSLTNHPGNDERLHPLGSTDGFLAFSWFLTAVIGTKILKKDRNAANVQGKTLKKELSKLNKFELLIVFELFSPNSTPKKCLNDLE